MALDDPYITGAELGDYLDAIDMTVSDPVRDAELTSAAVAASREINKITGRNFNQVTVATPRIYVPLATSLVRTDDFYTTDDLEIQLLLNGETMGDPLAANVFELFPVNGVVGGDPVPYVGFRIPYPNYVYVWPYYRVQVTAKWGWAEVPANVIQAAKLRGAELFKRRDAPLGAVTVGSGSANVTMKPRPTEWQRLVCDYSRQEKAVFLG